MTSVLFCAELFVRLIICLYLNKRIADAVKADITSDWGVIDSVLCDFVHSEEFTSSSDVTDEELAKLIKEIISELDRTSIWSDDHGYKQT